MEQIETKRLVIRRFLESDWQDLYEYLSDKAVVKYEPYPVFSMEACVREAANRAHDPAFWAVCLKDGGKLIGNLYLQCAEPLHFLTWELGYVFNTKYHGQGYATESCTALLGYAFANMGAHRVVAHCDQRNTASWKLLERLDFRREGQRKQNAFFFTDAGGAPIWLDTYEYAMLAVEWAARHGVCVSPADVVKS